MDFLGQSLTDIELLTLLLVGLLIGMAKTGVHGTGMIAVPLLASVYGGKESSGLLLPILSFADVFGVAYYHRHAHRKHLIRLMPAAVIGVLIGTLVGNYINDEIFKWIMAITIFISLFIMIGMDRFKKDGVPEYLWFALLMGVLGGFTTMVGNLAGSVMALYLLAMKLPKNGFIGTAAWFFLVINLIKVPFHVLVWGTITVDSFTLNILTLPMVALGAFSGIYIIKRLPDKHYRTFIMISTAIAAIFMVT
jgi:hypothetical protein